MNLTIVISRVCIADTAHTSAPTLNSETRPTTEGTLTLYTRKLFCLGLFDNCNSDLFKMIEYC